MAIVFVLTTIRHDFFGLLTLDLPMVRHGQVWRLVTYLFLPDTDSPIWILLSLYWLWLVASNLEHEWGSFKLNVYYLVGMIGTTVAAWLSGGAVGNLWLNSSLVLAFATVFPEFEIYFFFILRLKVKWLGILLALFLAAWAFMGLKIKEHFWLKLDKAGLSLHTFYIKNYGWNDLQNIILKDGLLTLDLKSNKIFILSLYTY